MTTPETIRDGNAKLPPEQLRVLAVIPGSGEGSSFVFARSQVSRLRAADVHVHTMFVKSRTSLVELFRTRLDLRRAIASFRPHVVHAHFGTATSFLCAASTSLPLIITFRGSDLNRDYEIGRLRSAVGIILSQLSSLRSAQIICVSRQLADRLWWRNAVVLTDGIDLNAFQPVDRDRARSELGWTQAERVVLFNGGDRPLAKGLDLVQDAIADAERVVGRIRLVVLDGTVPPERMPHYYNAADCLALASLREGSPNVIKEAMACNLPVVCTDVGDARERLSEVHPSAVVQRDPHAFGEALAGILKLQERSNGREHARDFDEIPLSFNIRSLYEKARSEPMHGSGKSIELDRTATGI